MIRSSGRAACITEKDLEDTVVRGIRPMICTDVGRTLDRLSVRLQPPVPIHFSVDIAIGSVGAPYRQAASLMRALARSGSVHFEGTMMTFCEDPEFDGEQIRRFRELVSSLGSAGMRLGKKHAASSFALFQHPDSFPNLVRPGMALFGIYSEEEFRSAGILNLRPVLSLKARVISEASGARYNKLRHVLKIMIPPSILKIGWFIDVHCTTRKQPVLLNLGGPN